MDQPGFLDQPGIDLVFNILVLGAVELPPPSEEPRVDDARQMLPLMDQPGFCLDSSTKLVTT